MEVDCQIDIAHDLGYVSKEAQDQVEKQVKQVAALLSGLRNKAVERGKNL